MTLSTDIRIEKPVPALPLFHWVRAQLGGTPEHHYTAEELTDPDEWWVKRFGPQRLLRSGGLGLGAMVHMHYGVDGLLLPEYTYHEPDEPQDPPPGARPDGYGGWYGPDFDAPAAAIVLDLDTAYGYRFEHWGCDDLHAAMVNALAEHLDGRGGDIWWEHEYTGEWHKHDGMPRALDGSLLLREPHPLPLPIVPIKEKA